MHAKQLQEHHELRLFACIIRQHLVLARGRSVTCSWLTGSHRHLHPKIHIFAVLVPAKSSHHKVSIAHRILNLGGQLHARAVLPPVPVDKRAATGLSAVPLRNA